MDSEQELAKEQKIQQDLEDIYQKVMQKQKKQIYKEEATDYYKKAKASTGEERLFHMRILASMLDF